MTLRFCLLNCQGLVSRRTNKLNSDEFKSILSSNDIILLTETWTDNLSDTVNFGKLDHRQWRTNRLVVAEILENVPNYS